MRRRVYYILQSRKPDVIAAWRRSKPIRALLAGDYEQRLRKKHGYGGAAERNPEHLFGKTEVGDPSRETAVENAINYIVERKRPETLGRRGKTKSAEGQVCRLSDVVRSLGYQRRHGDHADEHEDFPKQRDGP
jgi:hypothetical protein